jgi:hypothetical protein
MNIEVVRTVNIADVLAPYSNLKLKLYVVLDVGKISKSCLGVIFCRL